MGDAERLRSLPILFATLIMTLMLGLELASAAPALLHLKDGSWSMNILADGRARFLIPVPFCWLAMRFWPDPALSGHLGRQLRATGIYLLGIILFFAAIWTPMPGSLKRALPPLLYVLFTGLALLHLGQGFPALRRYLSRSPS